jgi:hypothetical protein
MSLAEQLQHPNPHPQQISRRRLLAGAPCAIGALSPWRAHAASSLRFVPYTVTDPHFGDMRVGSMSIPEGWRARSQVRWDFGSANYPVHVSTRAESPDGRMWLDLLPYDAV